MFKFLILFLANVVSISCWCNIMDSSGCTNYKLVSEFRLPVFVPRDQWKDTCAKMRLLFECVYKDEYVGDCTKAETYFYDMQRGASNAVCTDGQYLNHVDCLGSNVLEDNITKACLKMLAEGDDESCDILGSSRSCITNAVMTHCGESDSNYMDTLVYQFLKPYAEHAKCQLEEPTNFVNITTKGQTSSTSAAMESTTTTSAIKNNTMPGAASATVASSLLIALTIGLAIAKSISTNSIIYL